MHICTYTYTYIYADIYIHTYVYIIIIYIYAYLYTHIVIVSYHHHREIGSLSFLALIASFAFSPPSLSTHGNKEIILPENLVQESKTINNNMHNPIMRITIVIQPKLYLMILKY